MGRTPKRKDGAVLYPEDFDYLYDPDNTEQDKSEQTFAIAEVVRGNYEFKPANRYLRQWVNELRTRIQIGRDEYERKCERNRDNINQRWNNTESIQPNTESIQPNTESIQPNTESIQPNILVYDKRTGENNQNKLNKINQSQREKEKADIFSLLDCLRLFDFYGKLGMNEPDRKQLTWHSADKEKIPHCQKIAGLPSCNNRADMIRDMKKDTAHMAKIPEFTTFSQYYKICEMVEHPKFSALQKEQIVTTFEELSKKDLFEFEQRFADQLQYAMSLEKIVDMNKLLKAKFKEDLQT